MDEDYVTFRRTLLAELNGHGNVPFEEVEKAIGSLDRHSQVLVRMKYMRSLTDRHISTILSLAEPDVSSGIEMAIKAIKDYLTASREKETVIHHR